MAVKRKTEAGAPAFTGAQILTFDRYRERRDLLGVLLDKDQRYTFSEVRSEYLTVAKLAAILRVANACDRSHKQKFENVKVSLKDKELIIQVDTPEDITLERGLFTEKAAFFEEVFSIRTSIHQKKHI